MQRMGFRPSRSASITAAGLVIVVIYSTVLIFLMQRGSYDAWSSMIIGPILFAVSLPALARQAKREGDPRVFRFLVLALAVKLAVSLFRLFVVSSVYGGIADATGYSGWGVKISEAFRSGHFVTGLASLSDTNFIRFLTGVVYTAIGPSEVGGFLVFSWLGFWGLFYFYRAFTIAVPEGRKRTYARLLFFLPSMLFWPSSIGKEAWMTFALGIAVFGVAWILTGRLWKGLAIAALGLWLAAMVRPHIAGLIAVSFAAAYLVRPSRDRHRELAPVVKGLSMAVLVAVALILVIQTNRFLHQSKVENGTGVTGILAGVTAKSQQGGSAFTPSVLNSPSHAPRAILTVLFRPLLFEAHNLQAVGAAAEGTFLLILSMLRWRSFVAAARSVRRQPYVAFSIVYVGLFIFAFSAIANFGLLVRQRVQLLPIYLVFLAMPAWAPADAAQPKTIDVGARA
jgi:hypothetical protein